MYENVVQERKERRLAVCAVEDRDQLPGPEGRAVRDGIESHADIESGASGPNAAECPGHRIAEPAGGCERESGL